MVDSVEWLGDQQVGRGCRCLGAAKKELEAGCTSAVREAYGSSQLNATKKLLSDRHPSRDKSTNVNVQVTSSHVVLGDERLLNVDDIVHTVVSMERGLDGLEGDDGAVRASSTKLTFSGEGGREADGIVERQTKGLVRLLAALAAIEEVLLEIVDDSEEGAARRIGRCVHTVRTGYTACEGRYKNRMISESKPWIYGQ